MFLFSFNTKFNFYLISHWQTTWQPTEATYRRRSKKVSRISVNAQQMFSIVGICFCDCAPVVVCFLNKNNFNVVFALLWQWRGSFFLLLVKGNVKQRSTIRRTTSACWYPCNEKEVICFLRILFFFLFSFPLWLAPQFYHDNVKWLELAVNLCPVSATRCCFLGLTGLFSHSHINLFFVHVSSWVLRRYNHKSTPTYTLLTSVSYKINL